MNADVNPRSGFEGVSKLVGLMPMLTNNFDPQKTEGNDADAAERRSRTDLKPATVVLTIGEEIDVVHHFWTEDNSLLNVHLNQRAGGIDATIPREHVEIVLRSDDAEKEVSAA